MNIIYYTVMQGDTLWSIAERFGTSVNDLVRFNGIENPDEIQVGQIIKIPVMEINIPRWYVVKQGDTVYYISKMFNVPMSEIIRLNNLENPDLIFPGQVLRIR